MAELGFEPRFCLSFDRCACAFTHTHPPRTGYVPGTVPHPEEAEVGRTPAHCAHSWEGDTDRQEAITQHK